MTLSIIGRTRESAVRQWIRGFWAFYRDYTSSAIHAASAAALTIFGLLIFIDPLFAAMAIASYVGPPLVLYSIGSDVGSDSHGSARSAPDDGNGDSRTSPTGSNAGSGFDSDTRPDRGGENDGVTATDSAHIDERESDTGADDGDTDSDSDDGDTDSDSDG